MNHYQIDALCGMCRSALLRQEHMACIIVGIQSGVGDYRKSRMKSNSGKMSLIAIKRGIKTGIILAQSL
jgi:hypothetical protein